MEIAPDIFGILTNHSHSPIPEPELNTDTVFSDYHSLVSALTSVPNNSFSPMSESTAFGAIEISEVRGKDGVLLQCSFCEYQTVRKQCMRIHLRRHTGEKPYSCPYCNRSFSLSNTLTCHIRIHTGEKPHACPHCSYRAIQPTRLKTHIKNKHKSLIQQNNT